MSASKPDLRVNGNLYDSNDMTFAEEREVRRVVREQLVGDPDVDFTKVDLGDVIVATAYVMHRRDNPEFSLKDALNLKQSEVLITDEDESGPPTQRGSSRAKKSTPAASGSQK